MNIERHYIGIIAVLCSLGILTSMVMVRNADASTSAIIKDIAAGYQDIVIFAIGLLGGVALPRRQPITAVTTPNIETDSIETVNIDKAEVAVPEKKDALPD